MQETKQLKLERLTADARKRLETRTTQSLIQIYEILNFKLEMTKAKQKRAEILLVFKWLHDELERRDEKAFDDFLMSDERSPRKFYL